MSTFNNIMVFYLNMKESAKKCACLHSVKNVLLSSKLVRL